jgi:hypothetical protein
MFPPYKSQVARGIPFDNQTNSFAATNVQAAIEEARSAALNNDRYPIQANRNANTGINTYLEIFPGEDSLTAPLIAPANSTIVAATIQASANTAGAIRIRNISLNTTLIDLSFAGTSKQSFPILAVGGINAGNEIGFLVVTAAINKPKIRVWFNTQP